MRHRPRPRRFLVLAAASFACAALLHLHVEPHELFLILSLLLAGATTYELIPGERRT